MNETNKDIKGYRKLSPDVIDRINTIKDMEEQVLSLITDLEEESYRDKNKMHDRWTSIALTNIEQGFMALVRSQTEKSK